MAHEPIFTQYTSWACIHTVPEYASGEGKFQFGQLGVFGEDFLLTETRDKWRAFCLARGGTAEETAITPERTMQVPGMPRQALDTRGYTERTNAALDAYFEVREREHVQELQSMAKQQPLEPEQLQDLDLWSALLKDDIGDIASLWAHPLPPATDACLLELDGIDIPMDIDLLRFDLTEFIEL